MILEAFIQALVLTSTVIATIRAGSRALYAFSHGNEIGVMDGPLILSPHDVTELRKMGNMDGRVSPLWEATYGFSEAVRLLHSINVNDNEDQMKKEAETEVNPKNTINNDVVSGNWKEEDASKNFYSLASPHKTKAMADKILQMKNESIELKEAKNTSGAIVNENRLVLMGPPNLLQKWCKPKRIIPSSLRENMARLSKKKGDFQFMWNEFCTNFWECHPLLGGRDNHEFFFRTGNIDDKEATDKEKEENLDFDTFYAKTIPLPNIPASISKDLTSDDDGINLARVAHVKAFAPNTFRKLRSRFRISEKDFLHSLINSGPYVSFQSNSKGAARVGGFFFFSRDGTYMVKTIKKAEIKAFLEMIPKYYEFMKENAKNSLLTRFCGLYSVKVVSGGEQEDEDDERFFLIMNSVFPAESSKFISERFDLKGSTVGRECSEEEKETKGSHAVLKDLDLAREVKVMNSISPSFRLPDSGICIGSSAKAALLAQLRKDLKLLVDCSVMDYSLLVGVVNTELSKGKVSSIDVAKKEIEEKLTEEAAMKTMRRMIAFMFVSPINHLAAPLVFLAQQAHKGALKTLSKVLTLPFPYYGAGTCGINGGEHSIIHGTRLGQRAVFYMGVIDFLQPWSTQKVLERQIKGVMGYDKSAISCVDPEEYATRFLDFLDKHIT